MNVQPQRQHKSLPSFQGRIVLALVAICVWFGPRFVREVREANTRQHVKNNLTQVRLALQNYHARHSVAFGGSRDFPRPDPTAEAFSVEADQPKTTNSQTPNTSGIVTPDSSGRIRRSAVPEESLSSDSF